ncbi:MAG: translocation/assembly module TamB domain-containing protein, partial [Acidobacteria bacterium]|nr:translocation/assembly module TamB domain-containing protein [Acidobacteriota bacterium]
GDGPGALRGQVSGRAFRLVLPGAEEVTLDTVINGRVSETGVELSSVVVRGDDLEVSAQGGVTWAGAGEAGEAAEPLGVVVNLRVHGEGRAEALSRLGYLDGELSGPVTSDGRLSWVGGEWAYRSSLRSPRLGWLDLEVADLVGELRFQDRELSVDIGTGRYLDGELSGRIQADFEADGLPIEADIRFVGVSADRLLADRRIPLVGFASRLDGEIDYRCLKQARSRGSGWGQVYVHPMLTAAAGEGLPWTGEAPFTIENGLLASQAILLRAEGQRLWVEGEYDLEDRAGSFDFEVDSHDVGPLAGLLLPYMGGDPEAAWVPLAGHGRGEAHLGLGASGEASVDLRLDLENVRTAELVADRAGGRLRASVGGLEYLNLELSRSGGALLVTGGVHSGTELEGSVAGGDGEVSIVDLDFDAVQWPLGEIRSWRDLELPLEGQVSGRLSLTGDSQEVLGRFDGDVEDALIVGLPVERVAGNVSWDGTTVRLGGVEAEAAAGRARVSGTLDRRTGELHLSSSSPGLRLDLPPLADFFKGRLDGQVSFEAAVGGTSERPEVEAEGRIAHLTVGGRELARQAGIGTPGASGQESSPPTFRLRWDGSKLSGEGQLPGLGTFDGGGSFDGRTLDLTFDVESSEVRALTELASGRDIAALVGRLDGQVRVSGSAASPDTLRWGVALDHLQGELGGLGFEQLEPVVGALEGQRLRLDSFYLGEKTTLSELFMRGEVDLRPGGGYDLDFQGSSDLRWLLPLLKRVTIPPEVRLAGRFEGLGKIVGPLELPRFDGQGELRLEPFVAPLLPQAVEELVARFSFYPDRLELEELSANVGSGGLAVQGRVELPSGEHPLADYRFYAIARNLKLLVPEGWLQEGSAELWLTSSGGRRELEGAVQLRQARYLEELDVGLAQVVERLLERERQEVGPTEEWLTGTFLNLTVEAPDALRVRNRAASLRGDLDLEVRGSLARPVLLGKVDLQPGGTVRYADNEYRLERGLVTFNNPYLSEPVLDLVATSRVRSYEVSLSLSGTPEKLDLSVSSDPPLPELDVMALVTGGRPLDLRARPSLPGSRDDGQLNAEAFLYGQAASAITERVNTLFGFDKFRVDPLSDGSETVSSVRVTVGKRLSKDLFVTYSRDPSTTEQDILEAEWQINPQLTLVFTQNGDGSFSVDALWDRRF